MNKLTSFFAATLLTVTFNAQAGDCPALAGKYTIGKKDADFKSINEAVNALRCGGVSSAVNFLIMDGTYKEKVVISTIEGADAMNTVTFESKSGNNAAVIISSPTTDVTVGMNGTNYVAFENLTIEHKGATGNSMRVDGQAGHLSFTGIVFDGVEATKGGTADATIFFTSNAAKTDIMFEDCEVNNGSMGIIKGGSKDAPDTKTSITSTLFFNQYEMGIALSNEDAPVITNNVVNSMTEFKGYAAVKLESAINGTIVSNNIINTSHGSYGIHMNNCKAQATGFGQISNNSISVGGENDAIGLYFTGTTDNQALNFNRVKLTIEGDQASNQAYYRNTGNGSNVNLSNNIFYDLGTGGYTIIGNTYKDYFNQLPGQSNLSLSASTNGVMIEKVSPIK